jgi:hypothetical protein
LILHPFKGATHSHHDRTRMANSLRRRGQWIDQHITKTYRSHTA